MVPGCEGTEEMTLTLMVCDELLPHELFAMTETVPPLAPGVAVMDVVVEVPVQPDGRLHV